MTLVGVPARECHRGVDHHEARKDLATAHAADLRHDEAIRKGFVGAFYDVLRRQVDTDDQPQARTRAPEGDRDAS